MERLVVSALDLVQALVALVLDVLQRALRLILLAPLCIELHHERIELGCKLSLLLVQLPDLLILHLLHRTHVSNMHHRHTHTHTAFVQAYQLSVDICSRPQGR